MSSRKRAAAADSSAGAEPAAAGGASGCLFEFAVEGDPLPYRVLSWQPPRLVLARGNEVQTWFVAESPAGLWLGHAGSTMLVARRGGARDAAPAAHAPAHDDLSSPMPGRVLEVLVAEGERVAAGARLLVIEAMKMEHPLCAPRASTVVRLRTAKGASVLPGETLIELEESAS